MNSFKERLDVEAVLRELSEVEAPVNLGQDVALELSRTLQTRSTVQQRDQTWSFMWRTRALGAVCALIALLLSTYLFESHSKSIEPRPRLAQVHPAILPAAPTSLSQPSMTVGCPEVRIQKTFQIKRRRSASVQNAVLSRPAPVGPVTEQERLLIRIAQERDPVQTASLNTEVQDAMDTRRRNDFIKLSNGGRQ